MPCEVTHTRIHAHWVDMIRKVKGSDDLEDAVREVIADTAKLCELAAFEERVIPPSKRIDWLFGKAHGIAGWSKEAAL